jgi:integrase/recombinase XerD
MNELDNVQRFEQYLRRRFPDRRTATDYVCDVRLFIGVCPKPWREVTLHDIDQFVDQQREAQRKPATIKRRVAALKTYFDFLAEDSDELQRPNPVRFKRHAGKQPRRLPRDLSDETVEQVWNTITSPRDRAWFALMLRAGLRVNEVVSLQQTDLLASPRADQPARLRVCGKGQKERIVLLTADAYAVLKTWLQARPASEQPYVFLNNRGGWLTSNGIEWLLHQYGEQAGLPLTPHQLRHTYARQLTEAGMPLTSLSKLMGHAQVSTTQLYTAGADPELVQAYQTAMAQLARQALKSPQPTPRPSEAPPPPSGPTLPRVEPVPAPLPDQALPAKSPQPTPRPSEAPPPLSGPTLPRVEPAPAPLPEWAEWMPDLPAELRQASLDYVQRSLSTCKPKHQRKKAWQVLGQFRRFWTWQLARRPITHLAELHRSDLQAYQDERLVAGVAATTIDRDLDYVLGLLREQADRDQPVDGSVFRLRPLPRPDSLPRYLNEDESQRLEAYVQQRLAQREADPLSRLENACFFVLAHTGIRARECTDLLFQDLDLPSRRLMVRQGKGLRDRVVYLSETACHALTAYLEGIAFSPTTPLWIKPNGRSITDGWLRDHIAGVSEAARVSNVTPHRLRHTLATRLLNTGMDITRIQKLLGHEHLDTTLIYARALDTTVEADYRRAMGHIERQQAPLSDTPLPVANWPTQMTAERDQIFKELALDNSV